MPKSTKHTNPPLLPSSVARSTTVPLLKALDPSFRHPLRHPPSTAPSLASLRPVDPSSNASLAHLRSCALSRLQASWDAIIDRYSSTHFVDDDEIDLVSLEVVHQGSLLSHPKTIAFGSLTGYLDDTDAAIHPSSSSASTEHPNGDDQEEDEDQDDDDQELDEDDELITSARPILTRSLLAPRAIANDNDDNDDEGAVHDNLLLLAIRSLRPPLVVVSSDESDEDDVEEDELTAFAPRPPMTPAPSISRSKVSARGAAARRVSSGAVPAATTSSTRIDAPTQQLMDAIASASSPIPLPLSSPLSHYAPSPSSPSFLPLASPIPHARLSNLADTPCPSAAAATVAHLVDTPAPKSKSKSKACTKKASVVPVRRSSRLSLSSTLPAMDPDPCPDEAATGPTPAPPCSPDPQPNPIPDSIPNQKPKSKAKLKPKSKPKTSKRTLAPPSSSRVTRPKMFSSSSSLPEPPTTLLNTPDLNPPLPSTSVNATSLTLSPPVTRRRMRASTAAVVAALDPPPQPVSSPPRPRRVVAKKYAAPKASKPAATAASKKRARTPSPLPPPSPPPDPSPSPPPPSALASASGALTTNRPARRRPPPPDPGTHATRATSPAPASSHVSTRDHFDGSNHGGHGLDADDAGSSPPPRPPIRKRARRTNIPPRPRRPATATPPPLGHSATEQERAQTSTTPLDSPVLSEAATEQVAGGWVPGGSVRSMGSPPPEAAGRARARMRAVAWNALEPEPEPEGSASPRLPTPPLSAASPTSISSPPPPATPRAVGGAASRPLPAMGTVQARPASTLHWSFVDAASAAAGGSPPKTPAGAALVKHADQPVEHVWKYSWRAAMRARRLRAEQALAAAAAAAASGAAGESEQAVLSRGGVVKIERGGMEEVGGGEDGSDTEDELVAGAVVVVRGWVGRVHA